MSWLQLRLDAHPDWVAKLETQLLASGAVAVTLEDNADEPVLEPALGETPLWQHTRITGLYPADFDMQKALAQLSPQLLERCNQRIEILEDKDWEREWMQHYAPMQFGPRLWVCPSWRQPPDPEAVNLLLDPGLAFGTGTHPTTALCLEQLADMPLENTTVVDYGCGSGILAVAALKLGATRALGVDIDPQALTASRDNAGRNDIAEERLQLALPEDGAITPWHGSGQVVIANILAGPLAELAPTLMTLAAPGATLLLSGLLYTQAEALCQHYKPLLDLDIAAQREDWVCLRGELATH